MNKQSRLMKNLMRNGIIAISVIVTLGIVYGVLLGYTGSLVKEERLAAQKVRNLQKKHENLLEQHAKAKNSLTLYEKLAGSGENSTFSLDKKIVTDLLYMLNKKYELRDLNLSMSPIQEKNPKDFKAKTGQLIGSEVEIDFHSITDEYAFAFLQEMFEELSSLVNITAFSLKKDGDINPEALYSARTSGVPMLVKGRISFTWLGLKIEKDETTEENTASDS